MQKELLKPGGLTLEQVKVLDGEGVSLGLVDEAYTDIQASHDALKALLKSGKTIYGVNTGFGRLATKKIDENQLAELQHKLILSHSVGLGDYLDDSVVSKILLFKINSLSRGYSGVRPEVIEALITLYNHQCYPCIPAQGSVGASGDLAPLAHLSGVIIGEGKARLKGNLMDAKDVVKEFNFNLLPLHPKEGLALLNGAQVSTALAADAFFKACRLFESAMMVGALSVDAALGSDVPFDIRIHQVRNQVQVDVAKQYKQILQDSEIRKSHVDCERVQDPYSLRCQPQVMGAVLSKLRYAANVLSEEINAVTDNPLVFSDSQTVLNGGNFHAQIVAFAADSLALCLAEIGSLSERRTSLLMDEHMSTLPQFLIEKPGVNSGFMIAQVTAAALVHENKQLAIPSSVDSIPTSANQEDHVSMATYAARRLHSMCDNLAGIIAVELLAASQGIDFRKPLKTSPTLQALHDSVRSKVPFYAEDRIIADDLNIIKQALLNGEYELSQFGINSNNYM